MASGKKLSLLLEPADGHAQRLSLESAMLQHAPRPDVLLPRTMRADGEAPDDLRRQRWSVIVPAGSRGKRLLELLAPLIKRREEQQGCKVAVHSVSDQFGSEISHRQAFIWQDENFRYSTPEAEPLYQLLVGDLDEIPLAIQQVQSIRGRVGRIAFDHDPHYREYANKVLLWEDHPPCVADPDAILYTVHDTSRSNEQAHQELIQPIDRMLQDMQLRRVLQPENANLSSPDDFYKLAATRRPSVMLSVSHGVAAPGRGYRHQRSLQGAMSFGKNGHISGCDVAERDFLRGGVWLMNSCFSAGTPRSSVYHRWLAELREMGRHRDGIDHALACLAEKEPFISALAKAALSNPNGPLAVVGHIEKASDSAARSLQLVDACGCCAMISFAAFFSVTPR